MKPCDSCGKFVYSKGKNIIFNNPDRNGRRRLYGAYGHQRCSQALVLMLERYYNVKFESG